MEVTLNRDRHRWLLALERLQERGVFDGEMGRGVYRLRASAVALAKKIKPSDPRPHQLPEPAPIEYGQVLIDKAMEDPDRLITIRPGDAQRQYRYVQIGDQLYLDNGNREIAERFLAALDELRARGKVEQAEGGFRLSAATVLAERNRRRQ
jgi:hypothetical protein